MTGTTLLLYILFSSQWARKWKFWQRIYYTCELADAELGTVANLPWRKVNILTNKEVQKIQIKRNEWSYDKILIDWVSSGRTRKYVFRGQDSRTERILGPYVLTENQIFVRSTLRLGQCHTYQRYGSGHSKLPALKPNFTRVIDFKFPLEVRTATIAVWQKESNQNN